MGRTAAAVPRDRWGPLPIPCSPPSCETGPTVKRSTRELESIPVVTHRCLSRRPVRGGRRVPARRRPRQNEDVCEGIYAAPGGEEVIRAMLLTIALVIAATTPRLSSGCSGAWANATNVDASACVRTSLRPTPKRAPRLHGQVRRAITRDRVARAAARTIEVAHRRAQASDSTSASLSTSVSRRLRPARVGAARLAARGFIRRRIVRGDTGGFPRWRPPRLRKASPRRRSARPRGGREPRLR